MNLMLSVLLGIVGGTSIAFVRDALDQKIRAPVDVEDELGLPLLGALPALKRDQRPVDALANSRSALAEAYQTVRSALQFSTPDGFPKTLLVTSPGPGSGKTTTAFAIAQYVARLGFRVLLVEGDLRNPSLREIVEAKREVGLTSLLTGAAMLKETVQETRWANLFVVTAGVTAPNPAELLSGSRLPLLISEAGAHFDMVVFDGPPIMNLADAPILGAAVEGSILVIEAGKTTTRQVQAAMRRMSMAGAHVLGVVLNRTRTGSMGSGYGYGYGYGYGEGYGLEPGDARPAGVVALARRLIAHRRGGSTADTASTDS